MNCRHLTSIVSVSGPPRPICGRQDRQSGGHISCRLSFLFCKIQALGALPAVAALYASNWHFFSKFSSLLLTLVSRVLEGGVQLTSVIIINQLLRPSLYSMHVGRQLIRSRISWGTLLIKKGGPSTMYRFETRKSQLKTSPMRCFLPCENTKPWFRSHQLSGLVYETSTESLHL